MAVDRRDQFNFVSFVCVVCALTNLSQMTYMVETGITRYLAIPVWIIMATICMLKNPNVNFLKHSSFLTTAFLFAVYFSISVLFNQTYMKSGLPYPIFLSVFIFFVGALAGEFLTNSDIEKICTVYVLSATVVAIDVYMNRLSDYDITSITYAYSAKNSVSQILFTAWLIILFLKFGKTHGVIKNIFYFFSFVFLLWDLLMLKSRATLIGIPVILLWIVFNGKKDKKVRNIVLLLVVAVFAFFILNPSAYESLIDNVLLAGHDRSNIDAISSERADEWRTFGKDFSDSWLYGHGASKRESLILTSLLEFGILGGSIILILAIWPFVWGVRRLNKANHFYMLFTSTALVYFTNGIFEQLAPFGPGVKCYFLWFLFGVLLNQRYNTLGVRQSVKVKQS